MALDIDTPIYAEVEKVHVRKNVVQSILASEQAYTKTLDVLNQVRTGRYARVNKRLAYTKSQDPLNQVSVCACVCVWKPQ